jgi:hypothetical protein
MILTVNPAVVRVDNVAKGILEGFEYNIMGSTTIILAWTGDSPGPIGTMTFAAVTLSALGSDGQCSDLDIEVTELNDGTLGDPQLITPDAVIDGTFCITDVGPTPTYTPGTTPTPTVPPTYIPGTTPTPTVPPTYIPGTTPTPTVPPTYIPGTTPTPTVPPTYIPGYTPTPTYTPPLTPAPTLIYPEDGEILDNGRTDYRDYRIWDFGWSDVAGATGYHLYVTRGITLRVRHIPLYHTITSPWVPWTDGHGRSGPSLMAGGVVGQG